MAIVITEKMILEAETYQSLSVKNGICEWASLACVEENGKNSDSGYLRPLLTERYGLKQQYLMGILAQLYLRQTFEKQKFEVSENGKKSSGVLDCCMSEEAYDEWASSHVYSQINRFIRKKNSDAADKAYELMNDIKTFGIMLDKAIRDRIDKRNDPVDRIASALAANVAPDALKTLNDNSENIEKMLEQVQKVSETK